MAEDRIIQVNIEEEMKSSYIDYSMSVIVARALPDVRDGFKPVHRRILYGMMGLNLTHDKPTRKSARIVGDVLGKYHPHGDSSVYGALVRKRCVCQGYAEAYKLLLNDQGVPCEVVTGVVKGSTGRHAWNMISTDGKNFYHVDVTWDSLDDGGKRDKYFALRDDELRSLRTWNKKRWLKSGCDDLLAQARAIVAAERRSYAARGVPLKYLD